MIHLKYPKPAIRYQSLPEASRVQQSKGDGPQPGQTALTRRQLLVGRAGIAAPVRPPWALAEAAFREACDRCGDCMRACPERIVAVGIGGWPELDLEQGGCTLCGDCLAACGGKALRIPAGPDRPFPHRVRIAPGCLAHSGVECRSCMDACDTRAIRFRPRFGGPALPELAPDLCTGCGQCIARCPSGALALDWGPDSAQPHNETAEHRGDARP